MSRLLKGQKGTRFDPPKPFRLVLNAAPEKGAPEMKMVAVAGCAEASVVICESCHPFTSQRIIAESLSRERGRPHRTDYQPVALIQLRGRFICRIVAIERRPEHVDRRARSFHRPCSLCRSRATTYTQPSLPARATYASEVVRPGRCTSFGRRSRPESDVGNGYRHGSQGDRSELCTFQPDCR